MPNVMHSPAFELLSQKIDDFVFIRSIKDDNAAVRIHMISTETAVEQSGVFRMARYSPESKIPDISPRTCIIFYYADKWAIGEVRRREIFEKSALSLCFGSDIKTYRQYQSISSIVDCFLMPSQYHADILAYGLMNATSVVREGIDPLFPPMAAGKEKPAGGRSKNVVWFGYGESFLPGMDPIIGVVQHCLEKGYIDRFAAILNRRTLDPRSPAVEIMEYSPQTLADDMRQFDYALLSHIPGDLEMNSFVKSSNKVVSTLSCGLIPLASDTPNYRSVLSDLGLENFLFRSPFELMRLLENLDAAADLKLIENSGSGAKLEAIHSFQNIFSDLVQAGADALKDIERRRQVIRSGIGIWQEKSFVGFGDHVKDMIPSGIRAAMMRRRAQS